MIKFDNSNFEEKNNCYWCITSKLFLYGLLFNFLINLNAQNLHFKNFTAIDGLSSSEVYDITQDNMGYLWFATDRGLTCYDGRIFKKYTTSDGLPDNVIFNFFKQKDGKIWCSTQNHKIFYFKNAKSGFHEYLYNQTISDLIPKNGIIVNLAISKKKELLLDLYGLSAFLRLDSLGMVTYKPYKPKLLKEEKVFKTLKNTPNFIFRDNDDIYNNPDVELKWSNNAPNSAFEFTRMSIFSEHKLRMAFCGFKCYSIDTSNQLTEIEIPNFNNDIPLMGEKLTENLFWTGYQYGGGAIIDLKGNVQNHFLKKKSVTKIYKDHEGGIWVATLNAGVFYSKEPLINYNSFESYPIELAKDENKKLFITFHNGEIREKKEEIFSLLYKSLKSYPAYIEYDKKKRELYYGDFTEKKIIDKKRELKNYVYGVSDDQHFTMGFGRRSIAVKKNDTFKIIKIPEQVYDFSKKDSTFLIGTLGGLYEYKGKTLKSLKKESPLFSYRISDIDTKYDNTYISTMGAGLVIRKKDTLFSIDKKSGLLSDICTEVFIEDPYTIWIGTNRGLNRITLYKNNTYDIDTLSIDEGLLCSEILDIEIIDDVVWIASKEGLFNFPKKILEIVKKQKKKWLEIDRVQLGDKILSFKENLVIKYPAPDIKLFFKSISFKNENIQYRYKIREKDEWKYTYNTSIDLPDLSFGNYQLILQVKTENGLWTESLQKSLIILPPFWKYWWFILSVLITISIFLFLLFKYRILVFNNNHLKVIYLAVLNKLRINEQELYVNIKSDGKIIKLVSKEIGYFKSSRNYVEIYTENKKYLIRKKLDDFYKDLPDLIEFVKVHRSYYVRLDKVIEIKGDKEVFVFSKPIPVSKTYAQNLKRVSI